MSLVFFVTYFFNSIDRSVVLPAVTVTFCWTGPVKDCYATSEYSPGGTSVMLNLPSVPVSA